MKRFDDIKKNSRYFYSYCLVATILVLITLGCNSLSESAQPATSSSRAGMDNQNQSSERRSFGVIKKQKENPSSSEAFTPVSNNLETNYNSSQQAPSDSSLSISPRKPIPRDVITLLYRKKDPTAPGRQDPTCRRVTDALEKELLDRQYKIPSTPVEVLRKIDRSPGIVICFSPDAGFSMTYSLYSTVRPDPGAGISVAEVAIHAKVYVGSSVLCVETGRGTVRFRDSGQQGEYGKQRGMEEASQRAAANLVKRVDSRLKNLSDEQIQDYADIMEPHPWPAVSPSETEPLAPPESIYLLVAGIWDYRHVSSLCGFHVNSLPGVKNDIRDIQSSFRKIGVAQNHIKVLENQSATAANLRKTIVSLANNVGSDDLLVLYISGHGVQVESKMEGMSMPVLYNFSLKNQDAAPDFSEILEAMTQSAANRFLMIADTCHSGGAASVLTSVVITSRGVQLSKAKGSPSPQKMISQIDTNRNIAVLASSRLEEVSWEDSGNGLFTKYLNRALIEARPEEVVGEIVKNRIAKPVIEESQLKCARQPRDCPTGQQTPTLGFSGLGSMIRIR